MYKHYVTLDVTDSQPSELLEMISLLKDNPAFSPHFHSHRPARSGMHWPSAGRQGNEGILRRSSKIVKTEKTQAHMYTHHYMHTHKHLCLCKLSEWNHMYVHANRHTHTIIVHSHMLSWHLSSADFDHDKKSAHNTHSSIRNRLVLITIGTDKPNSNIPELLVGHNLQVSSQDRVLATGTGS